MTSLTIPESVDKIGSYAFKSCPNLISIQTRPSTSKDEKLGPIDSHAFDNCKYLASITIPSLINTIGSFAFQYLENLVTLNMTSNLLTINESAFSNCKSLINIEIPEKVTNIYSYA